jgi:RNA polymerase sigma-70 factor (ECF subfamily)
VNRLRGGPGRSAAGTRFEPGSSIGKIDVSSSQPGDRELVRRCIDGDQRAFEDLLDRYESLIFNAVLRMVTNYEDARDTTQAVFVKAFANLSRFDPRHKFFSWIYRIAVNESLNLIGKRTRTRIDAGPAQAENWLSRADDHRAAEARRDLSRSLARLKPDYRVVIILKHILGCSYRDIAGILDLPEKTVKSRLYTGRELLRRDLLAETGRDER